ncbi:MAG TPA: N-acetyltransferase [Anaerolineales bacterium]|jgi:putative acetyltransferase|nr:N-acetyltransferase [Anaerolineales bacterium]
MEIIIRSEEAKDIDQVRAIVRAAFPSEAESKLVDALRTNGKAVISLVAVTGDNVLGHILFSPVSTTPPSQAKGLGLAPVAVRRDAQAQGIGSKLIREGLRLCNELGFDYCVVLGGPKYYQRFGFDKASPFGMRNEYGVDDEFMIIRFSDRGVEGLVQYATEFRLFSV